MPGLAYRMEERPCPVPPSAVRRALPDLRPVPSGGFGPRSRRLASAAPIHCLSRSPVPCDGHPDLAWRQALLALVLGAGQLDEVVLRLGRVMGQNPVHCREQLQTKGRFEAIAEVGHPVETLPHSGGAAHHLGCSLDCAGDDLEQLFWPVAAVGAAGDESTFHVTAQVPWLPDNAQQRDRHFTLDGAAAAGGGGRNSRAWGASRSVQDAPEPRPLPAGGVHRERVLSGAPRGRERLVAGRAEAAGCTRQGVPQGDGIPVGAAEQPPCASRIATEISGCGSDPHRARTAGFGRRHGPFAQASPLHPLPQDSGPKSPSKGARPLARKPARQNRRASVPGRCRLEHVQEDGMPEPVDDRARTSWRCCERCGGVIVPLRPGSTR